MRILFDTNVVIDAAVPERTHHALAIELIGAAERGLITGLVAPVSISTCWYVATVHHDVDPRPLFEGLEQIMELAPMSRRALRQALAAPETSDFEDVYLGAAGRLAGAEMVVTRNESDFAATDLTPYHPRDLSDMIRG